MKHKMYIIMLFVVLLTPVIALAFAPESPLGRIVPSSTETAGEANKSSFSALEISAKFADLINWFSWFIALVSVVMGLYAGFLFITARGEAAQLKTARGTLLWAVIGIAVAVLAFSIIAITKSIFTLG